MKDRYEELKKKLAEIHDVHMARSILSWDQHTKMPPKAGEVRAEQLGTLDRIAHELFIDDDIGALLEELRPYEESHDYDSDEASLLRVTRREYAKATRVPSDLRAELTRAGAIALAAWVEARQKSDFAIFLPYLRRNVELQREYVACFPKAENDYDVLLDDFDEGMKTTEVRAVFDELKTELIPLIAEITERADAVDNSCLTGHFPIDKQRAFALEVLEQLGYDHESWRLDPTVHPFAMSAATTDIRLTTRYEEGDMNSLMAAIHEFGHGFYEAGIDPRLERTPLSQVTSMSLHESQSRMWENLVGRSLPFWKHFYPRLQAAYPGQFERRRARRVLSGDQQGRAVADPHRGRRGDLQPAHHPALRAGAGDPRWLARPGRSAGGLERSHDRVHGRGRARRRPRCAAGRALVGRSDRLLPDLLARQRHLRAALGPGARGDPRPRSAVRARRVRRAVLVAPREPAPERAQVHLEGDARAPRRRRDRLRAVPEISEGQARRDLRDPRRDRRRRSRPGGSGSSRRCGR